MRRRLSTGIVGIGIILLFSFSSTSAPATEAPGVELKLLAAEVTILQERAARLEAQYHLVMRDLKEKQLQLQALQAKEKGKEKPRLEKSEPPKK